MFWKRLPNRHCVITCLLCDSVEALFSSDLIFERKYCTLELEFLQLNVHDGSRHIWRISDISLHRILKCSNLSLYVFFFQVIILVILGGKMVKECKLEHPVSVQSETITSTLSCSTLPSSLASSLSTVQ